MAKPNSATKGRGLNMRLTLRKPKAVPETDAPARVALADQPYVASLPGVNVLPPGTLRRQRNRAMVRKFVTAGIAIAVVAVVCYGGSFALNVIHQRQLDEIRQTNAALSGQVAKLQPYSSYQTSLDNARKNVSSSLTSDLDVGRLLRDLNSVAARYGVTYTQISVTTNGGTTGTTGTTGTATSGTTGTTGGQCLNPDPFNPPTSIGCITLSGTTASQANATAYFNQFNSQTGFLNGFISGLTTGTGTNGNGRSSTFNGTVAFDSAFYSNKYRSYAAPLSSLLQGGSSSAATSTASIAQLKTALAARYPSVFTGVSDSTLTGMATSVCAAANTGSATLASLQTVVNTSLNKSVSTENSTGIIGSTISLVCPTAQSKVTGISSTTGSTTTNG